MRLDIGNLDDKPSDQVPGLAEKLEALLPTIYDHRCSIGTPGGFLERVRGGTYAGHMVEHVAIELQNLVGFSVGYGKTVDSYEPHVYNVVYRYRDEACGAGRGPGGRRDRRKALQRRRDRYTPVLTRLKEVRDDNMLGPSTASIVEAARRGISPATV